MNPFECLLSGFQYCKVIYRPSLIWNWSKLDVLPIIPFFNLASALGVPFVDKTVHNKMEINTEMKTNPIVHYMLESEGLEVRVQWCLK